MTFMHKEYLVFVIIFITIFSLIILKSNNKFFTWVEDHWFFKRSKMHYMSTICYLVGIAFLGLALMDLRGPEKRITGKTSDQKTIILVDTSASMLAEDVRPNRFNKALILVKHYVKRAVGQKVSLFVFSDGIKKIVPFTDDYNLIDARIETLKQLNLSRGGTGLSMAIQESIQYFKNTSEKVSGNILIFTDAEETDGGINLDIPDGISVGIVAIGTSKGAPIPMRNKKGVSKGNKKHKGKVVITKLDSKFLESMGEKIKNYRFWIATSYSLPTQEIIEFFNKIHTVKNSQNEFRIRPVLAEYLLIPGILLLGISFILGRRKVFVMASILTLLTIFPGQNNAFAQTVNNQVSKAVMDQIDAKAFLKGQEKAKEKKEPVKSERTLKMEDLFVNGNLGMPGKKALAAGLLKDGFPKDSQALYEEILDKEITANNKADQFNQATAMLKNKQIPKAINQYGKILKHLEENPSEENSKLAKMTKENILKALKQSAQGSGESDESEESSDESEDKKDSDSKDKSDEGKPKDSKAKDSKPGDDKSNEEGKDKNNSDTDKDKKDEDKKDGKDGKEKEDGEKNKGAKEPESGEEKSKRKKKLPALLKQLISDDNQLQKKMIDAKTTERKSRDRKDW